MQPNSLRGGKVTTKPIRIALKGGRTKINSINLDGKKRKSQ